MIRFTCTTLPRVALLLLLTLAGAATAAAEEAPAPQSISDPKIPVEELELLLKPLTRSQLLVEAEGWQGLLQGKAEEIARTEVMIKRQNTAIDAADRAGKLAEEAAAELQDAADEGAASAPDPDTVAKAKEALETVQAPGALSGADVVPETLERTAEAAANVAEEIKQTKVTLLEQVTALRTERTALIDRLRTVLDALERKTDEGDADTLAKIKELRLYSKAVSGIKVEVNDTTSAWVVIKGWLLSDEGGKRWAFNLARFLSVLVVAWLVARLVSAIVRHGLGRISGTSRLLEDFLVRTVRWVIMLMGIVMALSTLEVSIGPLLAVVGAAGFAIAFALQNSLSNFASGLMILFYKPFDVGDVVDAGGVSGKVDSMNLVSTTILTFDNKRMVVPNNNVWNGVITNATGVTERRVDMEFGIGYDDDIDRAQAILTEIITSHPKVLKQPEPVVKMHALADSSINFIARPWAHTADYWDVFWDVTREVKRRFDQEGIGIPFPQRDVHLYLAGEDSAKAVSRLQAASAEPAHPTEDGGLDEPDQS